MADIKAAMYPILLFPFHGVSVFAEVRELTRAQIFLCGDFSLIETLSDKMGKRKKTKLPDLVRYGEQMHRIVKMSLISPTYEQFLSIASDNSLVKTAKQELDRALKLLESCPYDKERRELEEQINRMKIQTDLLLPEDFCSAVACYALQINKTDIKDVADDLLLKSAILAKRGHDNPVDHAKGWIFSDFNRDDFNCRAWYLYDQEYNKKKAN